jgi:HD-like signal output (HDOD) protein
MMRLRRSRSDDRPDELRKILGNVELPSIPELVTTAIEQVSAPECDMQEVARTVGLDPGISARLLSVVNSAAFAPRNPIVGVGQAVTMFGKNRLESMLISLAVSNAVARTPVPGFDMDEFWTVAAWRASTAAALSRRVDRAQSAINFSAALLQNIAVPLLVAHHKRYPVVHDAWRAGAGELAELENKAFGWNHFQVAGWLFEEWGFPGSIRDAVNEAGTPTNGLLQYPVVHAVSHMGSSAEVAEVIAATARRINVAFGIPQDDAIELLEFARKDSAQLAGYLI